MDVFGAVISKAHVARSAHSTGEAHPVIAYIQLKYQIILYTTPVLSALYDLHTSCSSVLYPSGQMGWIRLPLHLIPSTLCASCLMCLIHASCLAPCCSHLALPAPRTARCLCLVLCSGVKLRVTDPPLEDNK